MAEPTCREQLKLALVKAACDSGRSVRELKDLAALRSMSLGYAHLLLEELTREGHLRHATDETGKRNARYRLTHKGLDLKGQLVIADVAKEYPGEVEHA